MSEKITACLVVCNEEKLIGRCLASLRSAVDEIIVAHDGPCGDRTLEIAQEYGAKIFVLEKIGECDPHRPLVYGLAADWILRIDADEFLSEDLRKNLRNLAADSAVDAYDFVWPYWDGKKKITHGWPYKRCLFRRNKISFLGLPHFVPQVNGTVKIKDYVLEHQPLYNNYSFKIFRQKWLGWAKIHASYYAKDFKDVAKLNWSESDWPRSIKLRKKFPLLMIFPDAGVTFFNNIHPGKFVNIYLAVKIALIVALYRGAVDYYLYFNKH
jgi:glycosyltransferase involved in cell wall biosynthesis